MDRTSTPVSDIAGLLAQADEEVSAGRQDKAFVLFGSVLAAEPRNLDALKGAGRALLAIRRLNDSAETWEAAYEVAPDDPEVLFQCGVMQFRRGAMDAACEYFDRALAGQPTHYGARGMRLLAMFYQDSDNGAAIWRAQQDWGRQRPAAPLRTVYENDPDPDRPLRIGYVSSDFRAHSVGFNLLPIYQRRDRERFRLYSYAEVPQPDAATRLFEEASDVWHSTVGLSDVEVAEIIVADKIDILVILAGHLDENRPYIARYRPAPIQINQYDICSSAMDEYDYFIGDRVVTPRGGGERFSERVIRLPTFSAHTIPAEAPAQGPLPALRNGYVTFGSFNAPQKISDRSIDTWAALLHAIPASRLVLKHFEAYSETATRTRILNRLAERGIGADRATVLDAVDRRSEHLRAYDQIDIALDSFPFSGATTTYEALLMGVPVITLAGDRFVSRCSAATLDAAGLGVCIAHDTDSYVARAVELASDAERLAVIRGRLRQALTQSRVCDADQYVRNLGRVHRAVWRRWCFRSQNSS